MPGHNLRTSCPLLLLWLAACAGPPPAPTPFARGSSVPIGPYSFSVSDVEAISSSFFSRGIPGVRTGPDTRILAVSITWDRKDGAGRDKKMRELIQSWVLGRFRLQDDTGATYRVAVPMPADLFRAAKAEAGGDERAAWDAMLNRPADPTRAWTVLFSVPQRARGFTLLVDNPDGEEGQPRLAAIPLGR